MGNIFHRENEIMLTVIQFFIYVISYYYIFDIDDLRKGGETIPQFVFEGEGESLYPPPRGYSHILATVYGYVSLERVWF